MSNPRRDQIKQFLENPQLPARIEFTYDDPHLGHRLWFSLIVSPPLPDRNYRVFWEYLGEVGSQKSPERRFPPEKWGPELKVAVFDMMKEDLTDTPFETPKVVVERPNKGMSSIGDIAALALIKR